MEFTIKGQMKQYEALREERYRIESQMRDMEASMCDYILTNLELCKAIDMGLLKPNFRTPMRFLEAVKHRVVEAEIYE
jgi:hypothetical protein